MKKLIMLLCCSCFSSMAFASGCATSVPADAASEDTGIKLEGFFGFQSSVYRNQEKLSGTSKNITDNNKNPAFYTEAAFMATVKQELNDITAGAKIVLLTTTKPKLSAGYNGSHIFIETEYGKVELGSPHDAASNMSVTPGLIAAAVAGFGWSRFAVLDDDNMKYQDLKPDFDTTPGTFHISSSCNSFDDISNKTEASRKISYYTPEMQGFQFGISYIPDSANTGGNRGLKNLDDKGFSKLSSGINKVTLPGINGAKGNQVIINQNVKDAVSAGISYKYEILEDVSVKVAVTGEYAKPANKIIVLDPDNNVLSRNKLSNLTAYNLGAVFTYGNISCAASYGNLGKSLTSNIYHKVGRNTQYYNGAVAYGQGPMKTSVSYFRSLKYKNTVDTVSLGTQYLVTPGLLPYAEISYFQAKGKPVYCVEAPKKKTRGTVALIGARLKF
ncbi:porin [Candidatus Tisiphia endosymbiont of Hybos culiciformis]|uniref:porin n=1 Tax=Candidatus Tisiphia endosymbiont of Hybos culiciformis TaxID=3139331 RepID=UPI003CCA7C70